MKIKRLLTLFVAICMVISVLPLSAIAATNAQSGLNSNVQKPDDAYGTVTGTNGVNSLRGETPSGSVSNSTSQNGKWNATVNEDGISVDLLNPKLPACLEELKKAAEIYDEDDIVSVFVVMEALPLVTAYNYKNAVDPSEEEELEMQQETVITLIEEDVLNGEELDVTNQFTYLTNSIVINTEFGNLDEIARLPGVKSVFLTPVYQPCTTEEGMSPYTVSSGGMSGVSSVWETLEYTGKGMTIAILDTGLDMDHPAFAADPALGETSWDAEYVASKLDQLNVSIINGSVTAEDLYMNAKVPFTFDYALGTTDVNHDPNVGDHGSHVAGIAGANAVEGSGVVGMAPDAQIIVMKVFNPKGGAYMNHIVAALEDAMTLGVDVANLSLGSVAGFSTTDEEVMAIYERIAESDIIVDIAAGNEGTSSYDNMWGTNLNPTAHPDNGTVSSPATYPNAMGIASVDNKYVAAAYFTLAGGKQVFYMDSVEYLYGYIDIDLTDIAGQELEYVMVPGLGTIDDFAQVDVAGKVAVVSRGETSFHEKAINAQDAGAAAVLIWDNVTEDIFTFGMTTEGDMGIPYIPVALISYEDGIVMSEAESKTMTVSATSGFRVDSNAGQMSSFTSWGVTPDLRLLPDLSGVGGNVYSCYDGGIYGLMSGTSMATPQVAGITALLLQYLKETFPEASESEIRVLADSLLMSTAIPVVSNVSGVEASPRQQGAGLVNALYAITSEAYLTVKGSDRPKAELFDSEDGTYSFTFAVHNYGDEAKTYTLASSLLTEDYVQYEGLDVDFMAGYDVALSGSVEFDHDNTVVVGAGESVEITVTITLSESDKAWFAEHYENGGYVEGFVYLNSEESIDLSLPFMGFYGDWTDAPLFDSAYWYDNSMWGGYYEQPEGNEYWHIIWTSLEGTDWVLGFNPYIGGLLDINGDAIYDPSNNIVSNNGDGVLDGFDEIYLSLMRNARTLTFTYTNEDDVALYEVTYDYVNKSMYISAYGQVVPFVYSWYGIPWDFTDASGDPLPSGTELTLTISGTLDYEGSPEHFMEQIPIILDTEAPVLDTENITEFTQDGRNYVQMTVTEEALAAAYIYNSTETRIMGEYYGYDIYPEYGIGLENGEFVENEDGTYTVTLDVTGFGSEMVLVLCDYGANESFYDLSYETANLPEVDLEALYGYRVADAYIWDDSLFGWVTIGESDGTITQMTNDMYEYYAITAAEYVDGYVFAVDAGYNFVVMEPGLWNRKTICNLGVNVVDMAFDDVTDTMYLLTKTSTDYGTECTLSTLDIMTGEVSVVYDFGSQYSMPWAMTFVDGTMYCIKYYFNGLYTFNFETGSMDAVIDAEGNDFVPVTSSGAKTSATYGQSMTYSEKDGKIYWAYYSNSGLNMASELFVIDPVTLEYTTVSLEGYPELVGLYVMDNESDYQLPEATGINSVIVSEMEIIPEGWQTQLTATVLPWNYDAEEVIWTSDDESIATVDENGVVTGISQGYAVITATCEGVSAECFVSVINIETDVFAYNYFNGTDVYGDWIKIDMETMSSESLMFSPVDFIAADYNGHDGYIYGYDEFGQFYKMNAETGEAETLGTPVSSIPVDMAYDYSTGYMYAMTIDYMTGESALYYVDMNSGKLTFVASTYGYGFMTLACGPYGELFAISADGILWYLSMYEGIPGGGGGIMPWDLYEDEAEGETQMILEPQYLMEGLGYLSFAQSMCYDYAHDVLIWANPETSQIYWIDPYGGYIMPMGEPTNSGLIEFIGMHTIPAVIEELPYVPVESITVEDMVVLIGGTKSSEYAINPLNATNQQITWTSSDESVAVIDEYGNVTGVAEGTATITGTLVDGDNTVEVSFTVTVKQGSDNIYGYIAADFYTGGSNTWAEIYDSDTRNPNYVAYTNYVIYAEEYLDGKLYAYGYDSEDWNANFNFLVYDAETFELESTIDMGDAFPFVYDMTYDYTTGTMYCVAGYNDSSSDLYMVNMANGQLIPVMQTEPFFMTLAADSEGNLYAVSASTEEMNWDWSYTYSNALLYSIDVEKGTYEQVMDLGMVMNLLSSMAFDHDTGNLYWAVANNTGSYGGGLCMIDMEAQTVHNLGAIGSAGSSITGLYIIADNYPEVPDGLVNMTVTDEKVAFGIGASYQLEVMTQPVSEDVELTWSSSDESVATVDENGNVTGVSAGVAVITATTESNGQTFTSECVVVIYGEDDYYLTYNQTAGGFAAVSRGDTTVVTQLTEGETEPAVKAMTIIDGVIYAYDVNNDFFTTTEESGFVRNYIGNANVADYMEDTERQDYFFDIRDMVYDAANDRMLVLGVHCVDETSEWYGETYVDTYEITYGAGIYTMDMTTGELTQICELCTASYDAVGGAQMLAITESGDVYTFSTYMDYISLVDVETGITTDLTTLQNQGVYGDPEMPMAMTYDPVTCSLYLLFADYYGGYKIISYDIATSAASIVGVVGEDEYTTYAGLIIDAEHTHAWGEWVIDEEASEKTHTCLLCGHSETEEIQPENPGDGDDTGDDNTGDGDDTGDDNTGDGDDTGDDNTGDDNTGDDTTGGDDNTGDGDEPVETGDNTLIGLAAAAMVLSAMSIVALPKAKKFF